MCPFFFSILSSSHSYMSLDFSLPSLPILVMPCPFLQTIIGVVLAQHFGGEHPRLSSGLASFVVVLICVYVSSFAWSWGPLGWLVPSEIFPMEVRSAGQSITVAVNLAVTFAIAQGFLAMLCSMRYATFFFFAACVVVMTFFVFFFLPETKNVPIEDVPSLFQAHKFWGRILSPSIQNKGPPFQHLEITNNPSNGD